MAGYSSASWAIWCARNGCITKATPPPFISPNTTFGYTPESHSEWWWAMVMSRVHPTSWPTSRIPDRLAAVHAAPRPDGHQLRHLQERVGAIVVALDEAGP